MKYKQKSSLIVFKQLAEPWCNFIKIPLEISVSTNYFILGSFKNNIFFSKKLQINDVSLMQTKLQLYQLRHSFI